MGPPKKYQIHEKTTSLLRHYSYNGKKHVKNNLVVPHSNLTSILAKVRQCILGIQVKISKMLRNFSVLHGWLRI